MQATQRERELRIFRRIECGAIDGRCILDDRKIRNEEYALFRETAFHDMAHKVRRDADKIVAALIVFEPVIAAEPSNQRVIARRRHVATTAGEGQHAIGTEFARMFADHMRRPEIERRIKERGAHIGHAARPERLLANGESLHRRMDIDTRALQRERERYEEGFGAAELSTGGRGHDAQGHESK